MGVKQLQGHCPVCEVGIVQISRSRGVEPVGHLILPTAWQPWGALCQNCGVTWEYVTEQQDNGRTEVLISDGTMTYSLGTLPKETIRRK